MGCATGGTEDFGGDVMELGPYRVVRKSESETAVIVEATAPDARGILFWRERPSYTTFDCNRITVTFKREEAQDVNIGDEFMLTLTPHPRAKATN